MFPAFNTEFTLVSLVSLSLALFVATGRSASPTYQLDSRFSAATFFDNFDFFTGHDPTNGFVTYVTTLFASQWGLTRHLPDGSVYIGVDYMNVLNPNSGVGRDSVRISSKRAWGTGSLVVVDLAHVPGGQCGTWPAMWMLGPNWPWGGEIDIIEGVNSNTNNLMSLHTSPGCIVNSGSWQSGSQTTTNCDTSVNYNSGCGVTSGDSRSYGTGFNNAGGGVYATQITPTSISIWFFPRGQIPGNLQDPSTWGAPQANFEGCDVQSHFSNLQLVFDNTFCGDWGGAVWPYDATCAPKDQNGCVDFVASNPGAFTEAYWAINYVEVYTLGFAPTTSTTSTSSSKSTSHSTTTIASTSSSKLSSSSTKTSSTTKTTSTISSIKSTSASKVSSSSSKTSSTSSKPSSISSTSSNRHHHVVKSKTTSTSSHVSALARRTNSETSTSSKRTTSTPSHPSSSTSSTHHSTPTASHLSSPSLPTTHSTSSSSTKLITLPSNPNHHPAIISSSDIPPQAPSTLLPFKFVGCIPSTSFSSSLNGITDAKMSLDFCIASCKLYAFAGVHDTICFCSNTLLPPPSPSSSQTQLNGKGVCDLRCPGDDRQICGGGGAGAGIDGRDIRVCVSLTVYRNLFPVGGVDAGGLGNATSQNGTMITFQGDGKRGSDVRWGMGCLVLWLGFGIWAL